MDTAVSWRYVAMFLFFFHPPNLSKKARRLNGINMAVDMKYIIT